MSFSGVFAPCSGVLSEACRETAATVGAGARRTSRCHRPDVARLRRCHVELFAAQLNTKRTLSTARDHSRTTTTASMSEESSTKVPQVPADPAG